MNLLITVVSIKYIKPHRHVCGGSILDSRHILTAAHCVFGDDDRPGLYLVQYGVLDRFSLSNVIRVEKIIIHEDYENTYSTRIKRPHDIAVLRLTEEIPFGNNVTPAKLAPRGWHFGGPSVTSELAGWGETGKPVTVQFLQTAAFPLWSDEECLKYHPYDYDTTWNICAGELDGSRKQCTGDSGGPLYVDGIQVGIVSWSVKPCGLPRKPGFFTKVSSYLDWIQTAIES